MSAHQLDEESIFKVVREIKSREAQADYLQHVCAGNPDLFNRVVSLLEVHAEQSDFLESPAAAFLIVDEHVIERVGGHMRYKLLQELGEGGMGVVFMAEQTEPIERRVALKVIKPGMDTRQVIARFEAERQALALMDHPGIAKVLDGGTTDSGRPYFVMDLVRGIPITEYCDQHRFIPRQRLELFVSVCHAVQHAHQKGVIHRDLKPSNVLVAEYDEEPVAKIIDFGVVKAIGQRLTEKTMFTQVGQLVGSVDYMSPEQAKLNQLDVDTRTDVYSLGVLLYELLTGGTPFESKRLHAAAFDEMLRIIREEEPPRPSTRLSSSSTLPSIAAQRHTEPKTLTTLVRGELDWIVMKALDKDRSRRYQTANAMAMDVQRYLADEPVLACPPSAAYRFSKFARRNKTALLAAVLVAIALVAGTVTSTWQAVRATRAERTAEIAGAAEVNERLAAERERNEAQKQRQQADANLQKARAAVDGSFTMISESKLLDVPGLQPLRRDLLESALRFYQDFASERSDDPRVMADLAVTYLRVSQINTALDRNDDAIVAVKRALDIVERLRREHPEDRESQQKLAGFCTERRWTQFGTDIPKNPLIALQTLLRLERTWETLAAEHPSVVSFQADLSAIDAALGALFHSSERFQDGSKYFRKGVAVGERLVAEYPAVPRYRSVLADVSLQLAGNRMATGRADEAFSLAHRSVELNEALVSEFPDVPAYRWNLAIGLVALGDATAAKQPEQAEKNYRRGVELARSLLHELPTHRLYQECCSRATLQWGIFVHAQGRHTQAEKIFQGLAEQLAEQVAARSREAKARAGLAMDCFYVAQRVPPVPNQSPIVESLYQTALVVFSELADELPDVYMYWAHMGHCHQHLGWIAFRSQRLDKAMCHCQSATELFTKLVSDQPQERKYVPCLSEAFRASSEILNWQDKLPESLDAAESAFRLTPDKSANLSQLLAAVSEINSPQRREKALALLKPRLATQPSDEQARSARAQIHATLGQTDEAAAEFVRVIDASDDAPWWFSPRKSVCRELARWNEVWEKVAELRPQETTLWIGRAQFRALHGQWVEAASDYARVINARGGSDESFEYAALLLLVNDGPGYQKFCQELIAHAGEPQGIEAFNLARVCSIGPADGIDASRILDWANRGLGDRLPWTLTPLAVAEARAGQFELAIEHFQESNTLPVAEQLRARNYFGLALCHHKLGNMGTAREFLAEARQRFQQLQPTRSGGEAHFSPPPGEWIELHVLSREAEALIQSPEPPAATASAGQ